MEHQKSQADDLRSSFDEYNTDKSKRSKPYGKPKSVE